MDAFTRCRLELGGGALLYLALCCLAPGCDGQPASAETSEGVSQEPAISVTGGLRIDNPLDPDRPYNFDLGHVPYGEQVEQIVQLTNIEGRELSILDILPGCGCTVPSISYRSATGEVLSGRLDRKGEVITLPPDTQAELKLSIDTQNVDKRNQSKRVLVRVRSDSATNPYLTLEVHLIVDVPLLANPPRIDLREIPTNGGGEGKADIVTATEESLAPGRILSTPEGIEAELTHTELLGRNLWTLIARAVPPLDLGLLRGSIEIEVVDSNGADTGRRFDVEVFGQVVPDLGVSPAAFMFPALPRGRELAAEIELLARLRGQRVGLLEHRIEGEFADQLRLIVEPRQPDDLGRSSSWKLRLALPEGVERDAPFSGTVVLTLDDAQVPELRVPYVAR